MDDPAGRLKEVPPPESAADPPVIFISVGEASGDLHGAGLARALRARIPGVRLIGLGGPRMAAEGVEILAGLDDLAVMGFVEVLSRLPFFLRLRRTVFDTLGRRGVRLVIPVDYPGFNMRLARHARAIGIPVLYYIAPQVWAWHASRARLLARDADRVAVILPFEEDYLKRAGTAAEFVGHPLLDRTEPPVEREAWLGAHGLRPEAPLLALLPGSRRQEVERHLPVMMAAAELVRARAPDTQVAIGAAETLEETAFAGAEYSVVRGSRDLLHHATAAVVKSGTSTLEAALAGTPFVVIYRMHPVSFALAKRVVRVPHIALTNLVVGHRLVPELIQDEAEPAAIADALLPLLETGSPAREEMVGGLAEVRERLTRGGAASRVADIAADLLGER